MSDARRVVVLAVACLVCVCVTAGEDWRELVKQAEPLLPPGAGQVLAMPPDLGLAKPCEATDTPAQSLMHITIKQGISQSWKALIGKNFSAPLDKGAVCLLTLRARTLASTEASGRGYAVANVQINAAPYEKTLAEGFKPGKDWQVFTFPFVAKFDVPPGKGGCNIALGFQAQTLEIADLQLWKFPAGFAFSRLPLPPKTYVGREATALWRQAALERIGQLRRRTVAINVVDAAGRPVSGASVHVEMLRHAFGFGSAITARRMNATDADSQQYQRIVDEHFSRVVMENDLKHEPWKLAQTEKNGAFRRSWSAALLNWCQARGISVRGHYLCWGNMEPWTERLEKSGQPQEIRTQILAHARSLTVFADGHVCEYDAINHPVPFNRVLTDVLGPDIFVTLMQDFRALTRTPLWINEDLIELNRATRYFKVLEMLKARGVQPDGAGLMSHFRDGNLPSIAELQGYLDRLAQLVPHVEVTEYDLETKDDQLHADHLRDMLILHYAHPACTGFVMWGFWEAQHWRPDGALWRKDWTERPGVAVWREWVKGKWWTRADLTTAGDGSATCSAYHGLHTITVTQDGRTTTQQATITPQSAAVISIKLP